jgi:polyphosphate kinase 2 (PPK2 family)
MGLAAFVKPYLVRHPGSFHLNQIKPHDTGSLDIERKEANDIPKGGIEQLSELQERLYADNRWSVLLIFQAMDAAGKDSAIKHVMSGVNPQGVRCTRSSNQARRNWTTTFFGEQLGVFRAGTHWNFQSFLL